jgi:hypothetical protein
MAKKCQFRKKNGHRCDADAQLGKTICVFHDPERTTDGRRARRAGGLNRTRPAATLPPETPDHALGTTQDVANLLGDSINRLRRGELDPRVANAIGYLATVLLRALEQGPMEERMARLEATLGLAASQQQSNSTSNAN